MKLAPSLKWPALGTATIFTVLAVGACGDEAALPTPPGGSAGSVGSAGTGVVPTGGTGTSGSAQGGTATSAGSATGGMGTSGTGTTGGSGGNGGTGTGGGSGGSGAGGSAGGSGGAAGGTGGAPPDLKETVGGPLNGAMYLGTCGTDSNQTVCQTDGGMACPPKNQQDPPLGGKLTTDKTITLGGDPTKTYTITLHVQGEVEAKGYINGTDQNNSAAHPKMDGFYTGGTPQGGDDYNIYMARVSSPKQDYFLNAIKPPGVTDHTTYLIDYTAKIKANGGATIRMTAADTNCSMIKNCGPTPNGTTLCAQKLVMQNVDAVAVAKNPQFDFSKAYNGQWIVLVVTDVTQD